jgi:hypothetical protein
MNDRYSATFAAALVACLSFEIMPANGHHSFALFDRENTVMLSGTVKEFQWTNPHAWLIAMHEKHNCMNKHRIVLSAALLIPLIASPIHEGSAQSLPPEGLDLTGIWLGVGHSPSGPYRNSPFPNPPPFTDKGRELSSYWSDPRTNLGARCLPGGGPAGMMNGSDFFPIEIIQRPEQVTIIFELMQQVRRVFMDGRPHPGPDDLERSWMGHSIGHWDGATLVVDTIGVRAGPLNGSGAAIIVRDTDAEPRMPYTETMHAIERIRLLDDGEYLEVELTIDDPTVYTKPFTVTRYWHRSPETPIIEYICTENLRPEDEGYDHLLEDSPEI